MHGATGKDSGLLCMNGGTWHDGTGIWQKWDGGTSRTSVTNAAL
jgi:hypothetical protein